MIGRASFRLCGTSVGRFLGLAVLADPTGLVDGDKGFIDPQQRGPLERAQLNGAFDGLSQLCLLARLGVETGALIEFLDRDAKAGGDRGRHGGRRGTQSAFDLGQIRIRDPDHLGHLAHGHLRQLSLLSDEGAHERARLHVGHQRQLKPVNPPVGRGPRNEQAD